MNSNPIAHYSNGPLPILMFIATTGSVLVPSNVQNEPRRQIFLVVNDQCGHSVRADQPVPITVASLDNAEYSLVQPMSVTLQEADGEYVACFPAAEISTSGDTPAEAMKWLKDSVISTFELLRSNRSVLGPLPVRQLEVLEKYVGKKQIRAA